MVNDYLMRPKNKEFSHLIDNWNLSIPVNQLVEVFIGRRRRAAWQLDAPRTAECPCAATEIQDNISHLSVNIIKCIGDIRKSLQADSVTTANLRDDWGKYILKKK